MWRRVGMVVSLIGSVLTGCAPPGLNSPEAQVVKQQDDKFLPYEEVSTATVAAKNIPNLVLEVKLIGRRDRKTRAITTQAQLHIGYTSSGVRHYESARNEKAEALPMRQIYRNISNCNRSLGLCTYSEHYLIDLPEAQLRHAGATGYPIKIFGRQGSNHMMPIPQQLIATLFKALDGGPAPAVAASNKGR